LTIQQVVALKQELFNSLDELDRIVIDLTAAHAIDPACIQLLCAAHRTATSRKKDLALIGVGHPTATFRNAGFVGNGGCALDAHHSCLWMTPKNSTPDQPGNERMPEHGQKNHDRG